MLTNQAQVWKGTQFTIDRQQGRTPGTVIFHFHGPFTTRDMFGTLTPVALHNLLSFESMPGEQLPTLHILDLSDVPYMDSTGLGRVVGHFAHCRGKGVRMIVAAASPRVLELFRLTRVDSVIPIADTVAEADIQ